MVNIIHRIGIRSAAGKVYNALSTMEGLSNWWTSEVDGDEQVDGNMKFTSRTKTAEVKGQMMMQVKELHAESNVTWICVEGPDE
jgi:uncharacterized protein YndB with AHSA1/START domain